jgi:UDPglucose 6-dehydrogenase
MDIAVIGTGYVGTVAIAKFASKGNRVYGVDIRQEAVDALRQGRSLIYEPGLDALLKECQQNIVATTSIPEAVQHSDIIFIAVGTPSDEDGYYDLRAIHAVAECVGSAINNTAGEKIVVIKSTMDPDSYCGAISRIKELCPGHQVHDAYVPEFLAEGTAIRDFDNPDRIIIGTGSAYAFERLKKIYAPFCQRERGTNIIQTTIGEAPLVKLGSNALLALKVSFANELARFVDALHEDSQADVDVTFATYCIGRDHRIGEHFLNPSVGWGGSCFGKDIKALLAQARRHGAEVPLLEAVLRSNNTQTAYLPGKIIEYFGGDLSGKTVGVWGLAFKARTDDMRDSPAIPLVNGLLEANARVIAHDPKAVPNARAIWGDAVVFSDDMYDCAAADVLAIATEWDEYKMPKLEILAQSLRCKAIFDGRNILSIEDVLRHKMDYFGIGRGWRHATRG